jgi:hypothetical protein
VVPFFIWAPRRLRQTACALLILLQILIGLTGNYCFFNLLTIALCLLLIDDATFKLPEGRASARPKTDLRADLRPSRRWPAVAILLVTLPVNAMLIFSAFKPRTAWPRPIAALGEYVEPCRIVNGYGLFRVMT